MRYFRRVEITPDLSQVGKMSEILYVAATGEVISWMPIYKLYRGDRAKVESGEWKILTRPLNARDILELGTGNAEIVGNAIKRKDTSIIEVP